jgi:polar amino acid transport system substrate-binding protein
VRFSKAALLLLGVSLALLLAGCSRTATDKTLVVGMDLSYPPFETIDTNGQPMGVSVDLAAALAKDLNRPLRIENIPFVGLIPSLQNGRIDCVISSMTDTPERRQSIAFTDPYLSTGLAMLVGKDAGITSLADVDVPGKTVVVRQGTTGEQWARTAIHQAKVLSLEKENAAVLEVVQGKAAAFIYDQMSVWQNARQNPDTTAAILNPIRKESWAIGVRKDNEPLRTQINQFLKTFRERGGFEELGGKFLKEQKAAFEQAGIPFYF